MNTQGRKTKIQDQSNPKLKNFPQISKILAIFFLLQLARNGATRFFISRSCSRGTLRMSYMRPAKIGAKQNLKLVAGKNSNRQAQSNQNSIIWLWTYLKEDHEHTWCIQRKVLTFDGHAITLLNIKLTCDKIKTPWCDCSGVEPDKPKKMKRIKDSIMPILHPRNWPPAGKNTKKFKTIRSVYL